MQKHYYMTLDTETCGGFDQPLVYDIGFTIHDRVGNIYEKGSYVVREIFFGEWRKMKTAYYADKIPSYYDGIKDGTFEVASFWAIRKTILNLIKEYKVKAVIAYNAGFDTNALNTTMNYLSKFEEQQVYFSKKVQIWDSWHMACQTVLNRKSYFKDALENHWISEAGNCKTSAEMTYRHLTKELDFIESHTALSDAEIETLIFARCVATKKKMDRKIIAMPWQIPQPGFKAYCEAL